MRAIPAMALCFQCDIQRMGKGETGEGEVHPFCFREGDAHVLDEVFDEEAGIEVAVDNPRAKVRQRPTSRCPGSDRLHDRFQIEPRFVTVEQSLADADHHGSDQRLINHLCMLPGAGGTLVDDRLAHRFPARLQSVDHFLIAANHDRQPRFLRTDVAARHRRIDAVHTFGFGCLVDFLSQRRLAGGHIN